MARYASIPDAARYFKKHPRSITNWLHARYIKGYDDGSGCIKVDVDEIELALRRNPRMRDGRKRYGDATIVPMPFRPEVVAEGSDQ